jgi:2,4-dienoyl-CoA reductase-like NADH-dependent reductase (Old Yellow Enzyme family)
MFVLTSLLDPFEVKGLNLENRIVMPPMQTGLATTGGAVTEGLIEYYVQRVKALGLLIVEHSYVSIEGRLSERQLGIHDDDLISGLEKLSSSIHAMGTPVVIQINHAGKSASMEINRLQPVAPSPSVNARELSASEIEALAETYGIAAERAMNAGFDGVEVHGAHGFLLNQFYSPLSNKRRDNYGGSFENRIRFPLEIVKKVKETVGGRLLLYRLGSVDLDPAGTQIEDSKRFALELQDAGVDIIDVSGGLCGSRPAQLQDTRGYFIPQAHEIRQILDVPVIGVGGITDPVYANKIIQKEKVDLVAVGRALYNDPDWAAKAIERLSA